MSIASDLIVSGRRAHARCRKQGHGKRVPSISSHRCDRSQAARSDLCYMRMVSRFGFERDCTSPPRRT